MNIRSENNKIMLKIESMASRNERLVNISRKLFLFPSPVWMRAFKTTQKPLTTITTMAHFGVAIKERNACVCVAQFMCTSSIYENRKIYHFFSIKHFLLHARIELLGVSKCDAANDTHAFFCVVVSLKFRFVSFFNGNIRFSFNKPKEKSSSSIMKKNNIIPYQELDKLKLQKKAKSFWWTEWTTFHSGRVNWQWTRARVREMNKVYEKSCNFTSGLAPI